MANFIPVRRALLSVSDKRGLKPLAASLVRHGAELISTGGTAKALREDGYAVRDIADLTGFPEMMDGRVKTLHPHIHGAILAVRDNRDHVAALESHEIGLIDLVVVNLYPFQQTVLSDAERSEIIENIDIGGLALLRSAAKNHAHVAVVTQPGDYAEFIRSLDSANGATDLILRKRLAAKAFAHTASYDGLIAQWFAFADQGEAFPETLPLVMTLADTLRYGENPHQQAALYLPCGPQVKGSQAKGIAQARQVQGKKLSYNNINDGDAALDLLSEFRGEVRGEIQSKTQDVKPACVIVKHANPCGVALGETLRDAYRSAFECDTVSAFGGIIALNGVIDGPTAEAITAIFTEIVIAPDADDEARAIFARKKNLRLLLTGALPDSARVGFQLKSIAGGWLIQSRDNSLISGPDRGIGSSLEVVTNRAPSEAEITDALFAWTVAKHVRSNAIVYAKDSATVGIGAGQANREGSARIAAAKGGEAARNLGWRGSRVVGSAVASDAFFPFADGLLAVIEAGATCVIQPGGSKRDNEVIQAADEAGLAMIFTATRHFRH